MRRFRTTAILVCVWLLTRFAVAWFAAHDGSWIYAGTTPVGNDLLLYDHWAGLVGRGLRPYVDFALEYPPANLPFLVVPDLLGTAGGLGYVGSFLTMTVVFDGLAFVGLLLLTRGKSLLGPIAWLTFVPALGPVAMSRLDMVPAAALIWGMLLASRCRWGSAGASLGIAAGTKVFAGLVAPIWAVGASARGSFTRFSVSFVVIVLAPLLFFLDVPSALYRDVWQYHSGRGIAAESSWGSLLLLGESLANRGAIIELRSGAWEILNPNAHTLKLLATVAVTGVALYATSITWRSRGRLADADLAILSAATVVLSVALGNVLSAQYLLWCIAAVTAAAAMGATSTAPVLLVGLAAALTHLVYPVWFVDVLFEQDRWAIILLVTRNVVLLTAGALLLRSALLRLGATGRAPDPGASTVPARSDPAVEEQQGVPPVDRHG